MKKDMKRKETMKRLKKYFNFWDRVIMRIFEGLCYKIYLIAIKEEFNWEIDIKHKKS